jgi:hypothetical protein
MLKVKLKNLKYEKDSLIVDSEMKELTEASSAYRLHPSDSQKGKSDLNLVNYVKQEITQKHPQRLHFRYK